MHADVSEALADALLPKKLTRDTTNCVVDRYCLFLPFFLSISTSMLVHLLDPLVLVLLSILVCAI